MADIVHMSDISLYTKFTEEQLDTLRAQFGKLQGIDPCSDTFRSMKRLLDGLRPLLLEQIASANIKFLSKLALNRLPRLVPACGGKETPTTFNGRRFLYCWDVNKTGTYPGDHTYVDLDTDCPVSNDEYERIIHNR